ncbi:MAG: ROK family protein [Lachnospiraceae bacterium]|nr:ROK family protein [Lachnospiraceae bacterium]
MKKFVIGVDIGGTSIRFISSDMDEDSISKIQKMAFIQRKTVEEEVEENLLNHINMICRRKRLEGSELCGIGIAMAALFDRSTGEINTWPNRQKWNNYPLLWALKERYHVPIVFEDDANAAALGEQFAGAAKEYDSLAYVTVSTGIGCGVVINNSLLIGNKGWAAELGHIKVTNDDILCTCGAKGCLQAVASGWAIQRMYNKAKRSEENEKFELKDIAALALNGDKTAKELFVKAGTYIGDAIANVAIMMDVPIIVLGGGVILTEGLILEPILEQFKKSIQKKRDVKIGISTLYDRNGVIGACSLIKKRINSGA